jgi:hypothetical protein
MKKAIGFVGAAVLMCWSSAYADDTHTSSRDGSMTRAIEEVSANEAKNPESPGLPRARQRLIENAARHIANEHDHGGRAEAVERVERVERADRPDRPERVERPERPERPDRIVRVDRPEPPGRAKK